MLPKILLSGAAGTVGLEFFKQLFGHKAEKVAGIICLFRTERSKETFLAQFPHLNAHVVTCLVCDLTQTAQVEEVIRSLPISEHILGIHCAANVDWQLPLSKIAVDNVDATLNFCRMLSAVARRASLIYVSSAYTSPTNWDYRNAYEESKAMAEQLVRSKYPELETTTFSCSLVVGDSKTGTISRFHGLYPLIRYMSSPGAPFVVGKKSCLIDIVPIDWVVQELLTLTNQKLEHAKVDDVVAAAGIHRISLADLITAIQTEVNHFKREHAIEAQDTIPIISHRQWQFLKRSLHTWQIPSLPISKFRAFEYLLDIYAPYTQHEAVLPPKNIAVPAPSPDTYLGVTIQYWLTHHRQSVLRKYPVRIG